MSDGHVHTTPTRPKPKSNPRAPRSERARAPNSQAPVSSRQSKPAGTCPLHSSVLEFLGPFEEGFDDVAHVRDDLDAMLVGARALSDLGALGFDFGFGRVGVVCTW